jgi:hypothetical protein
MRLRWMSPSDNLGIRFLSPPDGPCPLSIGTVSFTGRPRHFSVRYSGNTLQLRRPKSPRRLVDATCAVVDYKSRIGRVAVSIPCSVVCMCKPQGCFLAVVRESRPERSHH